MALSLLRAMAASVVGGEATGVRQWAASTMGGEHDGGDKGVGEHNSREPATATLRHRHCVALLGSLPGERLPFSRAPAVLASLTRGVVHAWRQGLSMRAGSVTHLRRVVLRDGLLLVEGEAVARAPVAAPLARQLLGDGLLAVLARLREGRVSG
jgi:hypothetical protein